MAAVLQWSIAVVGGVGVLALMMSALSQGCHTCGPTLTEWRLMRGGVLLTGLAVLAGTLGPHLL